MFFMVFSSIAMPVAAWCGGLVGTEPRPKSRSHFPYPRPPNGYGLAMYSPWLRDDSAIFGHLRQKPAITPIGTFVAETGPCAKMTLEWDHGAAVRNLLG
jgi:hypothetical protein